MTRRLLVGLRNMDDGWLDGEGKAPSKEGIEWLEEVFPDTIPMPYIYPTLKGGVQMEWDRTPVDISLKIDLENHQGEYHSLDLDTDAEERKTLDLDKDSSWEWIRRRLSH